MTGFGPAFVNKWFRPALPKARVDLTGRVVIVTGANIGIGLEAAKAFYSMHPKTLILAVRSVEKGEAAKKLITGNNNANASVDVKVWSLDLASFDSVKAFGAQANKELDRLDILLENAGVGYSPYVLTKDGWENSTQTNVISTFMLAALLFPLLAKTVKLPVPPSSSGQTVELKPHVTIVASDVHGGAVFEHRNQPNIFKALSEEARHVPLEQYQTTKLIEILITRQFAEQLKKIEGDEAKNEIVVATVNPGFCRSELLRNVPTVARIIMYALFARTSEEGSRNLVWAALEKDYPNGTYISDCKVTKTDGYAANPDSFQTQEKLWKELADIVTPIAPETKDFWNLESA